MQLFTRLLDKLFPIGPAARILAAQFGMCDGYQAHINTETEELVFAPRNLPGTCSLMLGGNPFDLRLIVKKSSITLLNLATSAEFKMNYRERRLLQVAIAEWVELDNTEFEVVKP